MVAFDMIGMLKLDFEPLACCFVHRDGAAAVLVRAACTRTWKLEVSSQLGGLTFPPVNTVKP